MPRFCDPAPASVQVARARKFDPYPDPTIGPPIVGGRPLDYIDPRPEPDITKNTRFLTGAYPGAAYPPPPVSTPAPFVPQAAYPPPASIQPATNLVPIGPSNGSDAAPVAYGKALGSL